MPGVDLIGPLLKTQAGRIQDAFFFLMKTAESLVPKIGRKYAQTFHRQCVWYEKCLGGVGVNTYFKKEMFPSVHSEHYLNSVQAKNILKS